MAPAKQANESVEWVEIQPFTQPIDLPEGGEFVGVYQGGETLEVPDPNNEGQKRENLLHEFTPIIDGEAAAENVGLWGSAVLDKRLAEIPAGTLVRILYEGKQELDGGRTARRYRVWAAEKPF